MGCDKPWISVVLLPIGSLPFRRPINSLVMGSLILNNSKRHMKGIEFFRFERSSFDTHDEIEYLKLHAANSWPFYILFRFTFYFSE